MPRLSLFPFGHKDLDLGNYGFLNVGSFKVPPAVNTNAGPRTDFRGIHVYGPHGDGFIGSDPVAPGFITTKTTTSNSTAADRSNDITNIVQGDTTWPFLEINQFAGHGGTGNRNDLGEDQSLVRDGAVMIGGSMDFGGGVIGGGGGVLIGGRGFYSSYIYHDTGTGHALTFRTMSYNSMAGNVCTQIAFAGTRLTSFIPLTTAVVDLGLAANRWKGFFMSGDFDHTGTKIGVMGTAPITRPAAYTQTYATATRTHANITATAVGTTAATQTTPWGYSTQAQADAIVTAVNALITDMANIKQFANQLCDDLQAYGFLQ